jgi:GTP-binding protein
LAIFRLAVKNHKGVVIAVNKWDLEEKETNTAKEYEDFIRNQIAPFRDVPIVFTSATEKQRILKVVELAMQVYENRKRKVSTSELNDFFLPLIENYGPPAIKGKYIKVKYVTQLPNMPVFVFFCNLPQYINDPYIRFLENKLREQWNFSGVPIDIYFRKK